MVSEARGPASEASPWGFGGILLVNECAVEYLVDSPGTFEIDLPRIHIGDSESQQVLEVLVGLVCLPDLVKLLEATSHHTCSSF